MDAGTTQDLEQHGGRNNGKHSRGMAMPVGRGAGRGIFVNNSAHISHLACTISFHLKKPFCAKYLHICVNTNAYVKCLCM